MNVAELIKELSKHDQDLEVTTLWHGYFRNIDGAAIHEDPRVLVLDNSPRTE